jgi:RNA polymerase primary sigma factor
MGQRDTSALTDELWRLLDGQPQQTKRQLAAALRKKGWQGIAPGDVNPVLYMRRDLFTSLPGSPPVWSLLQATAANVDLASRLTDVEDAHLGARPSRARHSRTGRSPVYRGPEPRAWQREALDAWKRSARRGVVEAVTGTGKTTVGVLAAADAVERGEKVLILVPGLELMDQWTGNLQKGLKVRVGRCGGGYEDGLDDHDVLVATVQTASRWQMLPVGANGLLIADEVHRYGGETYARALEPAFDARLGLTATYERADSGLEECLEPYFGTVVAGCGYERALSDGVLAHFRVGFLGVDLTQAEAHDHNMYEKKIKKLRGALVNQYGCPREPFGDFMIAVGALMQGGHGDATDVARKYMSAFTKRRTLIAACEAKTTALTALAPVLASADRGLVFSETVATSTAAAELLKRCGVSASDFTSALDKVERRERLAAFRDGVIQILAAPRVLDEGIDVPEADVAIILAASSSKRQMIQRMGRILRPKSDGRRAHFVVVYARGTSEDPERGAHGSFMEVMLDVADEVHHFPPGADGAELIGWFQRG